MTEIAWIVSLLMTDGLPESIKKMCLERISEVEGRQPVIQHRPVQQYNPIPVQPFSPPVSQAQLADMAVIQHQQAPIPKLNPMQEVVTSQSSGGSTRGPNKMRGRL